MMIGTGELIVILCVILVLFGGKKLPELARNLGRGVREFKNACQGIEDENDETTIVVEKNPIVTQTDQENK